MKPRPPNPRPTWGRSALSWTTFRRRSDRSAGGSCPAPGRRRCQSGRRAPALARLSLGPPEQYAAELGRPPSFHPEALRQPTTPIKESFTQRLSRSVPARVGLEMWRRREVKAVREFVPSLRPAWWVLRGYLLIAIPALWNPDNSDDFPVPEVSGSHFFGLLLCWPPSPCRFGWAGSSPGKRRLPGGRRQPADGDLGPVADERGRKPYDAPGTFRGQRRHFPFELKSPTRAGHQHLPLLRRWLAAGQRPAVRPGRPPAARADAGVVGRRVRPGAGQIPGGGRRRSGLRLPQEIHGGQGAGRGRAWTEGTSPKVPLPRLGKVEARGRRRRRRQPKAPDRSAGAGGARRQRRLRTAPLAPIPPIAPGAHGIAGAAAMDRRRRCGGIARTPRGGTSAEPGRARQDAQIRSGAGRLVPC